MASRGVVLQKNYVATWLSSLSSKKFIKFWASTLSSPYCGRIDRDALFSQIMLSMTVESWRWSADLIGSRWYSAHADSTAEWYDVLALRKICLFTSKWWLIHCLSKQTCPHLPQFDRIPRSSNFCSDDLLPAMCHCIQYHDARLLSHFFHRYFLVGARINCFVGNARVFSKFWGRRTGGQVTTSTCPPVLREVIDFLASTRDVLRMIKPWTLAEGPTICWRGPHTVSTGPKSCSKGPDQERRGLMSLRAKKGRTWPLIGVFDLGLHDHLKGSPNVRTQENGY